MRREILRSSLADNGCFGACGVGVSLQSNLNHTTELNAAAPYPNGDVEILSKSSQLPKPVALTPIGRSMVLSQQLHDVKKLPGYTKKIENGLTGMDGFGGRVANLEAIYGDYVVVDLINLRFGLEILLDRGGMLGDAEWQKSVEDEARYHDV
ncbi:hypothetical protein LTR27_011706 [Elasticomyces elasticus]|nr:hypothetical protein LTR27_011706 [Elasticomyces elasticus]